MDKESYYSIPVEIYGDRVEYSQTLSKARCRTFYKYGNRNGAYITDEFAKKLIATMPYAPIKGIYEDGDYTDHGSANDEGRIYGVIPKENNFAWEPHLDDDGITREYACVDVILYTGIYKEAEEIIGKSQSMELYRPSIKGEWQIIEGQPYFCYTDGCFLGMQVLGDDVNPCFEGAAFFTLYSKMIKEIEEKEAPEKYTKEKKEEGGNKDMPQISFNTPAAMNYSAVWNALNGNYTEEQNWTVDYVILDMDEENVVFRNLANNACKKRKYSIEEGKATFAEDEEEAMDYRSLSEAFSETSASLETANNSLEEKSSEITEKEEKISEYETQITTLNTEKEQLSSSIEEKDTELAELREFKNAQIESEKQEVISTYSEQLSEEVLNKYLENLADYTVIDLEKSLAYELVKNTPSIFSMRESGFVPKGNDLNGLDAVISAYKK